MESRSPSKLKLPFSGSTQYRRPLKVCIIILLSILLLIGIYHYIKPGNMYTGSRNSSYFTVVVDCGSTGTRVNVYEWLSRGVNDTNLPVLLHSFPDNSTKNPLWKEKCHYHCMQTEPGLDKFVHNSSGIRASLEPLILWAKQQIPFEKHKYTPVFVLATAGLRKLSIEDRKQVLNNAEAVVKAHAFTYKKSWIRVLSGEEEAYYGWVALNYKMESFEKPFGLLDLGGSSLQVVMESDEHKDNYYVQSKIGSFENWILTYSLLAFGINEAFDRTVVMLSEGENMREVGIGLFEIRHPCLSTGSAQNYLCNGCFRLKTSGWKSKLRSVILVGDENWEQCKGLARAAAINSSRDWSQLMPGSDCKTALPDNDTNLLNRTTIPRVDKKFHALSGFFAVYNTLNLSTKANMTKIWEKGQQLCSTSSPYTNPNPKSSKYCFHIPYMASLIENVLCLGNADIYFGPGDVSWTLGAALIEADYLWLNTATTYSFQYFILKIKDFVSNPIFLFILLVGLVFIVYRSQVKLPMLGRKRSDTVTALPTYTNFKRRPN